MYTVFGLAGNKTLTVILDLFLSKSVNSFKYLFVRLHIGSVGRKLFIKTWY